MYNKLTKQEITSNFKSKLKERTNDGYLAHYAEYILNILFDIDNNNLFDLTQNELFVLRNRNGINDIMTIKTLLEIANEIGISKSRTKEIETKAYRKIFEELEYYEKTYCFGEFDLSEETANYIINNEEIHSFKDYYILLFSKSNSLEINRLKDDFINHFKHKDQDITSCPIKILGFEDIILNRLYSNKIVTLYDLISKPKFEVQNIFGSAKSSFFLLNDRLNEIGYAFFKIV